MTTGPGDRPAAAPADTWPSPGAERTGGDGGVSLWSGLDGVPPGAGPTAVTIGNFDGVHRGHRAIVSRLADIAHTEQLTAVALTFWPHPRRVMAPERPLELITAPADRARLLGEAGADAVLTLEFTRTFARLTPDEFVRACLVDALDAKLVVLGADARFGRGNSGTVETMREAGERYGFRVETLPDVAADDAGDAAADRFSSSTVRDALRRGDVETATRVLGRHHTVTDTVHHGFKRGRELGFPTANLGPAPQGMVPADGVYAGYLTVVRAARPDAWPPAGTRLPAALSIGTNPTFASADPQRTVEAYVLDRDDLDLYDDVVRLEFVRRLRPTLSFTGIDDLVERMHRDVAETRLTLRDAPGPAGP